MHSQRHKIQKGKKTKAYLIVVPFTLDIGELWVEKFAYFSTMYA